MNLEIIGEGATAKVYRDGDKAIKLYASARAGEAEIEARLQSLAARNGLPVPAVYGARKFGESLTALEMAYARGRLLHDDLLDESKSAKTLRAFVALQRKVHLARGDGFPRQADRIASDIKRNSRIEAGAKEKLLALLRRLDDGARQICHGDFHPRNILFDGKKHWIIDWINATAGNPLADACRTYLILREFSPKFSEAYLRLFCEKATASQDDALAWLPLTAAVRMAENIGEKSQAHSAEIVRKWAST